MKIEQTELPPGWVWTTMEEIADVVGGGTPKTNDQTNYEGGTIPWITPADLSGYTAKHIAHGARFITQKGLNDSSAKMMPAGTVLFTSRAPIGYVAIASNPVCTNQGFKSFVLKEGVLPDYVYWWLKGSKDLAESMASGTTFLELSGAKAKQIPIPVAPLDQQKHIVAEIEKQFSRLDEAVLNLKRVKANLKRYKAAVLKTTVEGHLVETEAELARREGRSYETGTQLLQRILETRRSQWKGKGKYKEPVVPDTTDLPELPEGWVWASVIQVADVASGNTPAGILDAVAQTGDVPWFKVGDMNHEANQQIMRHSDAWLGRNEVKKLGLRLFAANTVLFPKRGGAIATNKKRRLESPGCADLNVMGITPDETIALYFFAWFDGINLAALSDGSNVPQINHKDIEPLVMPLPPLVEQHRIVAEIDRRLSFLRETEAHLDANLRRGDRLRQSLLARAFSGLLISNSPISGKATMPVNAESLPRQER